jgi:tRNA G18 (ribose-2'-O)-methylase SpoU
MGDLAQRLPFFATRLAESYADVGTLPLRVILHDVRSLYNVGAFFRTADAVGLDRVCLSGITGRPPHREISKTALGAEEHVGWEACPDVVSYLGQLRSQEYEIVAIETCVHAVDLFDWCPRFPVAVLFGNEADGLPPDLLARCDTYVRIPMRGFKHSLNVATAGGVVLYELLRKYREL